MVLLFVKRFAEGLPKSENYKLFFDNWFCTLVLCILCTATFWAFCVLPLNSGLVLVQWYDKKCVNVCSNYANSEPFSPVQRWDQVNKKHININCCDVIKDYNKYMGGVDFADILTSLYRTTVKMKLWCLNLLFHSVVISNINGWLLYCCHCSQLEISEGLGTANKVPRAVGRPSKRKSTDDVPAARHKSFQPLPCNDVPYDRIHHGPENRSIKFNCRLSKLGNRRVYCKKM